jgi:hypothetical protein
MKRSWLVISGFFIAGILIGVIIGAALFHHPEEEQSATISINISVPEWYTNPVNYTVLVNGNFYAEDNLPPGGYKSHQFTAYFPVCVNSTEQVVQVNAVTQTVEVSNGGHYNLSFVLSPNL